jgi:transcriptional regulator with XRE-family HTH domain
MAARFGDNLRRLRQEKDWTQGELATAIGFKGQATIAALEAKDRPPSKSTIIKLAAALEVHTADLLEGVVTEIDELRDRTKDPPLAKKHRPAPEEFRAGDVDTSRRRPSPQTGGATAKHAPKRATR